MVIQYSIIHIVKDKESPFQSGLEQLQLTKTNKICLNIEKKSTDQKDRASILSYILRSINDDSEVLVDEDQMAQLILYNLKSQFKRVRTVTVVIL
jgi:hypothetical protein